MPNNYVILLDQRMVDNNNYKAHVCLLHHNTVHIRYTTMLQSCVCVQRLPTLQSLLHEK